jgi:hypothetical protein
MHKRNGYFRPLVFLVSSAYVLLPTQRGASDDAPPLGGDASIALYQYLGYIGVKLDCYFTIEEMPRDGCSNWIVYFFDRQFAFYR